MSALPNPKPKEREGLFRHLASMVRRYSREPETRVSSARHVLTAAINLYADHTSPGEAALMAAEIVADLARLERAEGAR